MRSSNRRVSGLIRGPFWRSTSSERPPDRAFRPDEAKPLEVRTLMSTVVQDAHAATDPAVRGSVAVHVMRETEESNVPYPTPAGPSESLNVYLPQGPVRRVVGRC